MTASRLTRRDWILRATGAATAAALTPDWRTLLAAAEDRSFRIAACDWSIGRAGRVSSLELAARIGLDGVQVSFDRPGRGDDLRLEDVRTRYREASREHGVEIASLAMGVLNQVPFASSPDALRWVEECIDLLPRMGLKLVLLAFFGAGDILGKPKLHDEVVRRLRALAPRAEKAGVVLGLETYLDAATHRRILDAVGSPAVQVYYDVANMTAKGYDIYREIRELGRKRICEVHCKENGHLLGQGKVDFPRVRRALDDIGYRGWLVIEGATVGGTSLFDCYLHNRKYLKEVFSRGKEATSKT